MGCGASSEAKPPSTSAANPDAGGSVASSAAEPPPSAKRSEASAEASGAPAPGSALFEPEPELKLTKEERHDEIVAGESTVVGGVVASTGNGNDRVSETSQLDRVADESADIENLATISDTSVDVAAATTPSAGIETGGTWSAQSRFSEKLSFSAAEVDQLAKSFAEKDSDQNGTLDFAEFSAHVGTLGEMSPLLVKRLFATFDKDSSGTIDQAEFLAGIAACCTGSKEEKMSLAFAVHDVDNDGFLVPEELDAMLRAFVIGSAKLAAQACNVMEIEDLDIDQDWDQDDNWDDVSSVLPSGGTPALSLEQERECTSTIAEFTTAIMSGDTNKDGKLSKEEFMAWVADPKTSIPDEKILTRWIDMFTNSQAGQ